MLYGYENVFTILLMFLAIIIVTYAQAKVTGSYRKYKNIKNTKNISGFEVARKILDANGLSDIHIVETRGELTDHYDPSRKVIRLSKDIFHGTSIAAASVAAHEVGHAIQDKDNYGYMKIRAKLVPVVNLITYIGYIVIFISALFGSGLVGGVEIGIGIILATLIFQIVTLPVEFDASKRAKQELIKLDILADGEVVGVKGMLDAAALTYVASVVSTLLSLLRLVIMARERD
ncbi:MAG TPA: zinc metallopeptidase [Tenericutes bacterium]|nr:zinc metallopeptidase [Mycoplasmatota bacterium]